ncbi:MAG: hypothetical protein AAGG48_10175 [Planctomycetota bacterium]
MSRAFRVTVKETVRRVIHAEDHVRTQLEMLEVLPCDQMMELLSKELVSLGFERDGTALSRTDGNARVVIRLEDGTVVVESASREDLEIEGKRSVRVFEESGKSEEQVRDLLSKQIQADVNEETQEKQSELQTELTDQLESQLADLRLELDQACNRATAAALKQKAAQLGQIKEMTEDSQSGSLTIVVEL